jgi:hypothetical protein
VKAALDELSQHARGEFKASIDDARRRVDAVIAKAQSIPQRINELPAVKDAQKRVEEAEAAATNFKERLVAEKIDPVVAYAGTLSSPLVIDEIGFDSNMSALCAGRLPKLNVRGSFAGTPFDLQECLQMAEKEDFRNRNRRQLENVVKELLSRIDSAAADEFVDGFVAQK